jgi:phosphonate transport system ATP-binding protein
MACRASRNLHRDVIDAQRGAATVTRDMGAIVSPVIRIDRVAKSFRGKRALDHVSATIHPGQFVAIIGRSGAGKTTLLRCLTRAVTAGSGSIHFGDVDLGTLDGRALREHRARVGMIYQQFNLVRRLRVIDNVLVGRLPHLRGWRRWAALARWFDPTEQAIALRCLAHVGMLEKVWQRADTLSGGEQQRVAIAKILAQDPRVILADEPVASLDVLNGRMVMDTLRRIASESGLTVIATLHHVDYARGYADRVLGLRAGGLVFNGPPAELTDAMLVDIFGEYPAPLAASDPTMPDAAAVA